MNFALQTRACKHKQLSRETQNVAVHGMGWWRKQLAPLGSDSGRAVRVNGSTWQWQSVSLHKPWNHEQGPLKLDQNHTFFFVFIFTTLSRTQRCRFRYFAKTTRESTVVLVVFQVDKILRFSISQQSELKRYEKHCTTRWLIKLQVLATLEATAISTPSPWAEQALLALS